MSRNTAAYFRLIQELHSLNKEPLEFIQAHPCEDNVLIWYFIIEGPPDTPYHGGEYMGKLEFPKDFPFNPPAISMITPNGRFQLNKHICLTISNFHPETWSPSWSVGTILMGLLSFMVGNESTTGALNERFSDDAKKRALALDSKEWNRNCKLFCNEFPDRLDLDYEI